MTRYMTFLLAIVVMALVACRPGDDDDDASSPPGDDDTQATLSPGDDDTTGDDDDTTGDDDDTTGDDDDATGDDDDATGDDDDATGDDFTPVDADKDRVPAFADCDDQDPEVHPGALEVCDEKDNDCDEVIDGPEAEGATPWYPDEDGDQYGDETDPGTLACEPPEAHVADHSDCDDTLEAVHPEAEERCDGLDNDCDGAPDEDVTSTFYLDADGDGFGLEDQPLEACGLPEGYAARAGDCDDTRAATNPAAVEVCNGLDEDCDEEIDEGLELVDSYLDADGDGYGDADHASTGCAVPDGHVQVPGDCDDSSPSIHPAAAEQCDGLDQDCDDEIDEGVLDAFYLDVDGDGYGQTDAPTEACSRPDGFAADPDDCNDADGSIHPGAVETCDHADNDCDGEIDDGALTTFHRDGDHDGFGDPATSTSACSQPEGYLEDATDCNDTQAWIRPGALEACNGIDDDCDGLVDEGVDGLEPDADPSLPVPSCGRSTLLITEVSNVGDGKEFIELYNPTAETVPLHRYYLSDLANLENGFTDNELVNVVNGNAVSQPYDYLVRFPEGAEIRPGELLVVAVHKLDVQGNPLPLDPALQPDFEIAGTSAIPDMVPAGGTKIDLKNVGLSNDREFVLLFYWDGFSSLIQDVDYFAWSNTLPVGIDRTGLTIIGPAGKATYRRDTTLSSQAVFQPSGTGASFCRKDFGEGLETPTGGNGIGGTDETGEEMPVTWVECSTITPGRLE